jgi:hypothetical protein
MAKVPSLNALHLIRHAYENTTARAVLGNLSQNDLKLLLDHQKAGSLRPALDSLLLHDDPVTQTRTGTGEIAGVLKKLPTTSIKSLATLWKASGPICT